MDFVFNEFKEEEILIHFTILGTHIDILLTTGMTINLDSGRRQACIRIKSYNKKGVVIHYFIYYYFHRNKIINLNQRNYNQ